MRGRTKGERRRLKEQSRERRDKAAKKRRIRRRHKPDSKPTPGHWLNYQTADIHLAIITHLRFATCQLVSGLAECRLTTPLQTIYSDLAFKNDLAFLDYKHVMIVGDRVTIGVRLLSRAQSGLPSIMRPLWTDEETYLLADPQLFDHLTLLAAKLVDKYHKLVEDQSDGA